MSNINRDYLIVLNPKTSKVTVPELNYYIYDKYTANLFVNLVTVENGKIVNMADADQYKLVLHVLKPTNEIQTVEDIQVFNKEKALFQIELDQELTKNIGRYKCELLTIDKTDHIVQSAKFSYRVKKSIYNDLDVVTETPEYPIIITLLDKLQDIDKYEEERRANEVARVAAEKARVKDYTDLRQTVTTDIDTMQEKIDSFDGKVQEVDNAVDQMRTNITNYQAEKNKELDSYKTQKDTQINTSIKNMENTIDTYKTEKDKQINDKITQQDTKIDKAIDLQNKNIQASTKALNDKLDAAVQDQNNTIAANNQAQNKVISDAVAAQNKTINTVVESDKVQNDRLDTLETNDTNNKAEIKKLQDKDVAQDERMTAIEAVNVEQNNRLDAIEIKNDQQDSRLNDVEAKNKKQDLDLKCLFAESHSERITLEDEVGNSVFLQNSKQGFATVDELKGNTLVNCNKDTDKELILNGNIDTSGYSTVTTTEGVDGGKVDVALEGNTMVNVCDQEDPIAITKSYEVTTGNHVALQGEYDGKCRPVLNGNTLVNLWDENKLELSGTYTKNNGVLHYTTTETIYMNFFNTNVNVFIPSTDYTIIVNITKNSLASDDIINITSGSGDEKNFSDIFANTNGNGIFSIKGGTTGVIKRKLTTKSDITGYIYALRSYIKNVDEVAGKEVEFSIIVLEGDYTNKPTPNYFTGLQSSFEDKLITDEKDTNNGKYKVDYKVTGKNKFNKDSSIVNTVINIDNGSIITESKTEDQWYTSSTIDISNISNITISHKNQGYINSASGIRYLLMDENYNPKLYADCTYKNYAQTLDVSNYKYMKISILTAIFPLNTIQIEEGTEATTYEPYKEYTKTFYLNSPLLEGDTIEQSGNNIVHMHRYNTITFDGSDDEKWVYWGNNTDNGELDSSLISFYLPFTNYKDFRTSTVFNNKFLMENTVWGAKTEIMALNADNIMSFQVALLRSKLATQNVAGFKTWLQANPITVAYELATPTREVISTNDNLLLDSYINGHLDVDTVVPIDKVVFGSYGKTLNYLYPNTKYTIQFESDNTGILYALAINEYDTLSNLNIVKGINKFNITTSDNITANYLWTNGIGFNMSKVVVTPKVEQTFGYFKGMKSVGECEDLEVVSSNNDNTLSNKQTMTHEPLRGLPNGVKDKYVIIDGKWYIERNTALYSFNGVNDNWRIATNLQEQSTIRLQYLGKRYHKVLSIKNNILCDTFPTKNNDEWEKDTEGFEHGINDLCVRISKSRLEEVSVEGFKKWLTKNPVKLLTTRATPTYEPIDYNPFEVYSNTTHISNNSNIPCNMVIRNSGFNCMLKPNTTYTVSSNNGLSSVVTKDSIGDSVLRFYNKDTTSVTKMNKVLVLEGDYITGNPPIPAFFKGMESAFEQELVTDEKDKNYGKYKVEVLANNGNLLDKENIMAYGNVTDNNKVFTTAAFENAYGWFRLKLKNTYKLEPGTYYFQFKMRSDTCKGRINEIRFEEVPDTIYLSYAEKIINPSCNTDYQIYELKYVATKPLDIKYIFIQGAQTANTNLQLKEFALSTTHLDSYIPYTVNKIQFFLNEPLRGVGDVKDKVYVKEDKVVVERNCASVTFSDSVDEGDWYMQPIGHYQITSPYNIHLKQNLGAICNKLPVGDNTDQVYIFPILQGDISYIRVQNGVTKWKTLEQFKQYLQQNPITVIYQLATPTYEEVEYFDLKLFVEIFKDTTIIYNSNIPVTSTINYTYSTPLTDAVNTVSDISDQQDSMIIDMATQVATMEMMLM